MNDKELTEAKAKAKTKGMIVVRAERHGRDVKLSCPGKESLGRLPIFFRDNPEDSSFPGLTSDLSDWTIAYYEVTVDKLKKDIGNLADIAEVGYSVTVGNTSTYDTRKATEKDIQAAIATVSKWGDQ